MVINFYANDFGILLRSCARKIMKIRQYFVKVTTKKTVAPFFLGHGVLIYNTLFCSMSVNSASASQAVGLKHLASSSWPRLPSWQKDCRCFNSLRFVMFFRACCIMSLCLCIDFFLFFIYLLVLLFVYVHCIDSTFFLCLVN